KPGCPSLPDTPQQVLRMEDHGAFYASPRHLAALDPVLRPQRRVPIGDFGVRCGDEDVKAEIDKCVELLANVDLEVVAVDITAPEVDRLGFKVVKVLIPGARPIDFGYYWPHHGGDRLYDAPVRMGYFYTARDPARLNRFPHPFP